MRPAKISTLFFTAALALAACSSAPEPKDPEPTTSPAVEETPEPEESPEPDTPEVETRTVEVQGGLAEVAVGPLAVDADHAVLRIEVTALEDGVNETFSSAYLQPYFAPTAVQLLDAEAGYVYDHGWSEEGGALTQAVGELKEGESNEFFIAYAAPETDAPVAVVPGAGFFTPPVIDAADAEGFPAPSDLVDGELAYPVSELQVYSEELGGAVSERQEDEVTTVRVSADVLFEKDSAELSSAADAALARAAGKITGEGELAVVGHTDDVGTREHNQELSEARAEAAAAALEGLVDLEGFDVVVEGRAFDDPAVSGTTEEARAENRRVEIIFTPAAEPPATVSEPGELPDPTGPVATGAEGVEIVDEGKMSPETYEVRLPEVKRFGDYLAGEIQLTNLDDEKRMMSTVFSLGAYDAHGKLSFTDQVGATRLTLADGDVLYYPLDYEAPDRDYVMRGGDRKSMGQDLPTLEPGQTTIVTVVWPGAIAGESVTLESPWVPVFKNDPERQNRGGPPFRLTDIPVQEG